MRLRADAPQVTRLSRKVLAGLGVITAPGVGGALIYALQTRDADPSGEELYSVDNRSTADGLAGLPRDYTGPVLEPPLPADLGGHILDAQNRGQPVAPPPMAGAPGIDQEEQRRLAEEEAARTSRVFFQAEARPAAGSTATAANRTLRAWVSRGLRVRRQRRIGSPPSSTPLSTAAPYHPIA